MRKPVCQFAIFKNCSFIFLFLQNPRAFPRPSGRLFAEKAVKRRILGGFLGSTGLLHKMFYSKKRRCVSGMPQKIFSPHPRVFHGGFSPRHAGIQEVPHP
ncbi:MAG: hypothetical protein ACLSW7_06665 [Acutalibacteraceae bacterium]